MDITQCPKFHRNGVSDAGTTTKFQVKLSAQFEYRWRWLGSTNAVTCNIITGNRHEDWNEANFADPCVWNRPKRLTIA